MSLRRCVGGWARTVARPKIELELGQARSYIGSGSGRKVTSSLLALPSWIWLLRWLDLRHPAPWRSERVRLMRTQESIFYRPKHVARVRLPPVQLPRLRPLVALYQQGEGRTRGYVLVTE